MLLHEPTQSLLLRVPDPFMLRDMIPQSRTIDHARYNIAVKFTDESARLLKNLGVRVPEHALLTYDWPGKFKPFAHQKVMVAHHIKHQRCFNFSEPGTCKTASALWAADYLMHQGLVHRVLVICPLSVVERTWMSDIFATLLHRRAGVVHGTREQRLEMLKRELDFYILNHDGVKITDVWKAVRARKDIDLIIVDEGDEFRNAQTDRYKALAGLVNRSNIRLWWMTGTPCPNEPTDAWAQARLVCKDRVPDFFGQFRRMTMREVRKHKWLPMPGAEQTAFEAMQPAIRFKKADCLDLPPVVTLDRTAQLTKEQVVAFEEMRKEMIAEVKSGKQILAVNAADKINKLRQILCGVVKDPKTEEYVVLPHKPRTDELLHAIQQASAKVYVIVPFKGIIQSLAREVGKHYSVGVLNGDVSPRMRDKIIVDFKTTPDPHVLLCHPKVTSHGLNFTEADTAVFYAPIYSNSQFQQVIERFNRPGQTRKMTIVRIGASALEWNIYDQVDKCKVSQDNILELYKSIAT